MSLIKSNHGGLGGSGAPGGVLGSFYSYSIDNALRLNRGDSSKLTFTPSATGDSNKIFTLSYWWKRG